MNLFKLAVGDGHSLMDDVGEMQEPKTAVSPTNVQYTDSALPNQLKLTTNFNLHIDDQGQLGQINVRKAMCYQSQDLANNVLTKKYLVMKKPIIVTSPNVDQHFVDCNNNLNPPIDPQMTPLQICPQKHFMPHPLSPLNINTQFHPPQFVKHLNFQQF